MIEIVKVACTTKREQQRIEFEYIQNLKADLNIKKLFDSNRICEHNIRKEDCKMCHGANICEHNKHKSYCRSGTVAPISATQAKDRVVRGISQALVDPARGDWTQFGAYDEAVTMRVPGYFVSVQAITFEARSLFCVFFLGGGDAVPRGRGELFCTFYIPFAL